MRHGRVIPGHDVFETDTPAHGELAYKSLAMNILSIQSALGGRQMPLLTALRRPNGTLAAVLSAVAATLALTLLVPSVSDLFAFGPLHADDLALTLGAGVVILVSLELLKPIWRSRLLS